MKSKALLALAALAAYVAFGAGLELGVVLLWIAFTIRRDRGFA